MRDTGDANTVRGYLGGANWGTLNLAVDNDWINLKLASLGVTSPGDVDLNGTINAADATAFLPHWRKTFTVGGLQVGDWVSRQQGDLDYSGDVDLADAYILHAVRCSGIGDQYRTVGGSRPRAVGVGADCRRGLRPQGRRAPATRRAA